MKRIITVMALLAIAGSAIFAQNREFVCRYFPASNGVVLPYRILYPLDFDPASRYPMLVFLHGSWNNAFAEPDFLSWFFKR